MKRFQTGFIYLVVVAIFILALSVPASPSAASTHATLLESIQQQINEIFFAVMRIQARILKLIAEVAQSPSVPEELPKENDAITSGETSTPTQAETSPVVKVEESAVSTEPVWKIASLPSMYLSQPLAILYRYSIMAGSADAVILSTAFTFTQVDVSLKDLEIYAFSDANFSVPAFVNTDVTKQNRVGKQLGYVDSGGQAVLIAIEQVRSQKTVNITIPARETYYFELRGTVVGKNRGAFVIVSLDGLAEVRLE